MTTLTRRTFLAGASGAVVHAAAREERLGVACPFGADETSCRAVLRAAREAGFANVQLQFAWTKANSEFLRALPRWLKEEDVHAQTVGAYVNCVEPANVLMDCRGEDFIRAIDFAPEVGARAIVAWTGGYGKGLMTADARNGTREAEDAICRFLAPHLPRIEKARIQVALESYITLTCPDAPSLARVLKRLPKCVGAVMDPPNLTPVARYAERDRVLEQMFGQLAGRIAVVHFKDFRMAPGGASYQLPGPLEGEMNYSLFAKLTAKLPPSTPLIAEHLKPAEFAEARKRLLAVLNARRQ